MALFRILGGCVLTIWGTWDTVRSLRYKKWRLLIGALASVMLGVILLGNWTGSVAARVILGIAAGATLIGHAISDLMWWRRSRQERKQDRPAPDHAWFLTRLENGGFAHRMAAAVEGWESMQDRKAKLDKRVESGQITSDTAERYLAAHRRLLIEGLGYNRPIRWPERMLASALLPLLASEARRSTTATRPSSNAPTSTGYDEDEQMRALSNG